LKGTAFKPSERTILFVATPNDFTGAEKVVCEGFVSGHEFTRADKCFIFPTSRLLAGGTIVKRRLFQQPL
jgi:hypothetical protein